MTTNPKVCSICDQRHITKPSTDWCSECNQALCTECRDVHAIIKALQHHSMVPISNYLSLGSSFSLVEGHCSLHDDKYQLFCQTHDCLLCLTCLEEHMKCEDVVRISKLTKDVKTSKNFIEAQKGLSDITLKLSKLQSHLEENLSDIKIQKESALREITQIREKMNNHLNQIENALETELCELVDNQCNNNIHLTLQEVIKEKANVEHVQQQMEDLCIYGSDLQAFFCLQKIFAKTARADQYLQTLADDGRLDKVTFTCNIVKQIPEFFENVKSLGSIQLQKIPSQITLESTKDKEAQLVGLGNISINDIKLNLVHTINLTGEFTGCCILPDETIVLCDSKYNSDCIQILHPHGELIFKIPTASSYHSDVTYIDYRTVAVSSDVQQQVHIINVDTKAMKTIPTTDSCYGITHREGSLLCCIQGKGIQSVNLLSEKSTTIVNCNLSTLSSINFAAKKIFYTNQKRNSVTCCDTEGNIIWTFRDASVVKDLRRIAVDNVGNVYIVSYSQNKLVVLSADGQQNRQLLSEKDGLLKPYAICYDKNKNRLLIFNRKNTGFLFDVAL
ncbi:uncharacterized protein LOC127719680 [Mytilus californianus]|uniref:uncharacterized protein LOC127719680 n=1 Tax=Mytilus californianus TaxID=6549 RepID=UPI0022450C5E|nr:uncharacterized protein LOC127719680 [Mytilus californianus]